MKCNEYYLLCLEYYYKTELYDRAICSKTNNYGEAIPVNSYERNLINKNAKVLYDKLLKDLTDEDYLLYYKNYFYFASLIFNRLEEEYFANKEKINKFLKYGEAEVNNYVLSKM